MPANFYYPNHNLSGIQAWNKVFISPSIVCCVNLVFRKENLYVLAKSWFGIIDIMYSPPYYLLHIWPKQISENWSMNLIRDLNKVETPSCKKYEPKIIERNKFTIWAYLSVEWRTVHALYCYLYFTYSRVIITVPWAIRPQRESLL